MLPVSQKAMWVIFLIKPEAKLIPTEIAYLLWGTQIHIIFNHTGALMIHFFGSSKKPISNDIQTSWFQVVSLTSMLLAA